MAHNIFEVKFCAIAVHISQSLALLFVEKLKLITSYDSIIVQIQYIEPILNTLLSGLVLHTVNEPGEITKGHFLRMLKFSSHLRENSFYRFTGQSISRIFR